MIHLSVDFCNCCDEPVENCAVTLGLLLSGVPPTTLTHEVIIPPLEEVKENARSA